MAEEKKSQSSLEHDENREADESHNKVARFPSDEADEGIVTMAAPSPLMLGLGLGLGGGQGGASKPAFTFMQLQELEHQALIFKYMVAGLPVPVHLVVPIWKSVAASSFASYHYPSSTGYGSLCSDYRSSMETEPGRCRRTDGKKWRCSRDVVPDHKYCERHIHRGRNRPRKPVEGVGPTGSGGASTATSTPRGTQLSISVSAGGREAIDTGGSGVPSPELGLSHSGSACKTATF